MNYAEITSTLAANGWSARVRELTWDGDRLHAYPGASFPCDEETARAVMEHYGAEVDFDDGGSVRIAATVR